MLFHFAPQIARVWIGNGGAAQALRLFAAFLPVVCLANVMTGYFTAANRIGTLAAVEVAEQLASMAVTAALLAGWAGTDAVRACQSVLFGNCCGACLTLTCLVLLRLREHPAIGPRIPMGRAVASTALPLALADVLKSGINTVENLMVPQRLALHRLTPDPLAAFGIVGGMVFPVLMFPACILFGLTELLIPELARCAAGECQGRIRYLTKRSLRIALLYGLFFGGLEYLLADRLCLALYGNPHAGTSLKAYAPLIPMLYCDAIVDAMTKGLGQQKICVRYNILTSAMDVALLWLLLPGWGMKGYFVSFTVTHAVNYFLSLRLLLTITGVRLPFYVPAFAVTGVVLAVWGAGWFSGIPGRITGYVLLLGSLWCLLRVTGREDILWLRGLLRKK